MIMGHVGFGGKFDHFIHAFHMPMFFVVSGIFFETSYKRFCSLNDNPCIPFIKRKFQTLLLPYIFFGLLHYVVWLVNNWKAVNYFSPLLHLLSVNTYALPIVGALWFLTALFITEVLYCIIFHYVRQEYIRHVVIILLALAGHAAYYFLPFTLPFAGSAALTGLALYHIGFLLKKYHVNFALPLIKALILGTITGALIFLNGYVNMRIGIYGFVPLYYVNVVASCAVGISFAKIIHSALHNTFIDNFLRSIGKNSIVYLCLNQITILAAFRFTRTILANTETQRKVILLAEHCAVLALTIIILFLAGIILSKTPLNVLLGRSRNTLLNIFAVFAILIIMIISICGTAYLRHNTTNVSIEVHVPNFDKLHIQNFAKNERLRKIIGLNLKYISVTLWNSSSQHKYALSQKTANTYPINLTVADKQEILRSQSSFMNWQNEEYLHITNTLGETRGTSPEENALRVWGHTCFILASALRFGIYDENITGIPRDDAINMTCKLIASLAKNHCANSFTGWGNLWQSALWTENIAFASWLMWDFISEKDRQFIVNMVIFEADRFIDYNVPYYMAKTGRIIFPNDTKAEENAWNSRILALAVCMLPEHNHNKL